MLKHLRIQNFKGWKDTDTRSIWLLLLLFFGANSSGKSSIGQFLMMLKQTIQSPMIRKQWYFILVEKTRRYNLSSYQEIVFKP